MPNRSSLTAEMIVSTEGDGLVPIRRPSSVLTSPSRDQKSDTASRAAANAMKNRIILLVERGRDMTNFEILPGYSFITAIIIKASDKAVTMMAVSHAAML